MPLVKSSRRHRSLLSFGSDKVVSISEELFIFARFQARVGEEDAVEAALRDMLGLVRAESGAWHSRLAVAQRLLSAN